MIEFFELSMVRWYDPSIQLNLIDRKWLWPLNFDSLFRFNARHASGGGRTFFSLKFKPERFLSIFYIYSSWNGRENICVYIYFFLYRFASLFAYTILFWILLCALWPNWETLHWINCQKKNSRETTINTCIQPFNNYVIH